MGGQLESSHDVLGTARRVAKVSNGTKFQLLKLRLVSSDFSIRVQQQQSVNWCNAHHLWSPKTLATLTPR